MTTPVTFATIAHLATPVPDPCLNKQMRIILTNIGSAIVQDAIRDRLEDNYSAIYVTLVSVMLGLALDDIVSIMRGIEELTLFNWLTAVFSVHVIFNAWVGYSSAVSTVRLVPSVWDALNVFILSVAHFALNSAIGEQPIVFFYSAACYSAIAGSVVYYNVWRVNQDDAITLDLSTFRIILWINGTGSAVFLCAGILAHQNITTPAVQSFIVALGIPFATLWLYTFLKVWRANGLPFWKRPK